MSNDEAREVWGAIVENPDFWAKEKHERMAIARQFGGDYYTRMGEEYLEERKDWDFLSGAMSLGSLIMNIPKKVAGSFGDLIAPENPNEEGLSKRLREYAETPDEDRLTAEERSRKFIPLPEILSKNSALTLGGIEDASESTGFMAVSMLSGLAGSALGTATGTGPVGTGAGFLAASGAATYKMGKTAITQQVLDAAEAAKGSSLTEEETQYILGETEELRTNHAVWEAGPEAVGNLIAATGIGRIFKGAAKGATARFAGVMLGMYGSELTTESITRIGQSIVEHELGIGQGEKLSWTPDGAKKAVQEVGETVFAITTLLGGGSAAAGKVFGKKEVKPGEVIPVEDPIKDVERRLDIIRQTPEVILEDKGIPTESPTPATPQEASAIIEPPPLEPTPQERALKPLQEKAQAAPGDTTVLPDGAMQRDVPTLPEPPIAPQKDPLNIQMDILMGEAQELATEQAGDLSRAAIVTEAINAGRIPDAELVGMYRELQVESLDIKRKRAIDKGMEKLSEDSNTLDSLEDLEERSKVIQRMKRTAKQIKAEMEFAKASGVLPRDIPGKAEVAPTALPSREKKGKASGAPLGAPASLTDKQPATTTRATTAPTIIEPAIEGATVPLESTIVPTPTQGTTEALIEEKPKVQQKKEPKIEKTDSKTESKRWKVTDIDGVEYSAKTKGEAQAAVKEGRVSDLRLFSEDKRGVARVTQKPLTEEQRQEAEEFFKNNKSLLEEYQEESGQAIVELSGKGEKLSVDSVRKRAQQIRESNKKRGVIAGSISRDAVLGGAELETLGVETADLQSQAEAKEQAEASSLKTAEREALEEVQEQQVKAQEQKKQAEKDAREYNKKLEEEYNKRKREAGDLHVKKGSNARVYTSGDYTLTFSEKDGKYKGELKKGDEVVGIVDNPEEGNELMRSHRAPKEESRKPATVIRRRAPKPLREIPVTYKGELRGKEITVETTADKAIKDFNEDIEHLYELKACIGG